MLHIPREEYSELKKKVQLYLSVNRFDAAEKLLKATLNDFGPLAHIHNLLGTIYHKQSRFVEALRQFETALEVNPQFIEAGLNLVATLCDLSRYEEARDVFSSLQKLINPRTKQPSLVMGRIANQHAASALLYQAANMIPEAIQEYRRALALYEDMPDIRMQLAKRLMESGQLEKAQQELELIVKQSPDLITARNYLGILYYKRGHRDLAKHQWEKALIAEPNNAIAKAYLAITSSSPAELAQN